MEANTFTGALLDRADDRRRRDPAWLEAQREHPAARAVVGGTAGLRVAGARLELVALAELRPPPAEPVLLGLDEQGPLFALDEDPPPPVLERPAMIGAGGRPSEPPPPAAGRLGLREAAATLSQEEGGLAAYAAAILNWHRTHRYCANCGAGTEPHEGGLTRLCPACGTQHHPRTDPVVIMLVSDGDRLLLGRQRAWPAGRYSALAGFVGPGESLEEAVTREVREEAGVRVTDLAYVSSQPWPFPASLMLGFTSEWAGGELGGIDDELQDVRWFDRPEVQAAAGESGRLLLPPRSAIARRLIEGWLAGRS
ncbi:MAG: NAD(+) diphosphatase [Thermoleophilaceae bacterium]|nr:NAD(+) diphosphatase [Thermoleophilaceae bacterium]